MNEILMMSIQSLMHQFGRIDALTQSSQAAAAVQHASNKTFAQPHLLAFGTAVARPAHTTYFSSYSSSMERDGFVDVTTMIFHYTSFVSRSAGDDDSASAHHTIFDDPQTATTFTARQWWQLPPLDPTQFAAWCQSGMSGQSVIGTQLCMAWLVLGALIAIPCIWYLAWFYCCAAVVVLALLRRVTQSSSRANFSDLAKGVTRWGRK